MKKRVKTYSRVMAKEHEEKVFFKPHEEFERAEVSRESTQCPKCGFKAAYKFIRCPGCNAIVKKEEKE